MKKTLKTKKNVFTSIACGTVNTRRNIGRLCLQAGRQAVLLTVMKYRSRQQLRHATDIKHVSHALHAASVMDKKREQGTGCC